MSHTDVMSEFLVETPVPECWFSSILNSGLTDPEMKLCVEIFEIGNLSSCSCFHLLLHSKRTTCHVLLMTVTSWICFKRLILPWLMGQMIRFNSPDYKSSASVSHAESDSAAFRFQSLSFLSKHIETDMIQHDADCFIRLIDSCGSFDCNSVWTKWVLLNQFLTQGLGKGRSHLLPTVSGWIRGSV